MRRLGPSAIPILLLAACSTPPITLTQSFTPGEVRTYRIEAQNETRILAPASERIERTRIVSRSEVLVVSAGAGGATLRLLLTPLEIERDGRLLDPPPPQEAQAVVGADGAVRSIESIGGLPAGLAADLEEVAPLLATGMPLGRVRIGDRWRRDAPAPGEGRGEQTGRLAGVRMLDGYRTAVVELETRRPIVRTRTFDGTELRLSGPEVSAVELSFAFEDGFPIRARSISEGFFDVSDVAGVRGRIEMRTTTSVTLLDRTGVKQITQR